VVGVKTKKNGATKRQSNINSTLNYTGSLTTTFNGGTNTNGSTVMSNGPAMSLGLGTGGGGISEQKRKRSRGRYI
jgi:hypothetical protein